MKNTNRQIVLVLMTLITTFFTSPSFAVIPEANQSVEEDLAVGKRIFKTVCFLCHGKTGEGDGGAAMFIGPYSHPRPNNFTLGSIKFRSTESGELPTLKDLMRTIERGIPGFMPSFKNLPGDGVRQVALYIAKEFIGEELPTESTVKFIEDPYKNVAPQEDEGTLEDMTKRNRTMSEEDWSRSWFSSKKVQKLSRMDGVALIQTVSFIPSATLFASNTDIAAGIKRGEKLFYEMQCISCHGEGGRGAKTNMKDERGLPIMAANLSRPETLGNGNTPQDIYRTIMTGLNGTPMPSFSDLFEGEEEKVWDLVHYILSLKKKAEVETADFSEAYFEYAQAEQAKINRASDQVASVKAEREFTAGWVVENRNLNADSSEEKKIVEDTVYVASSSAEEDWTQSWTASNMNSMVFVSVEAIDQTNGNSEAVGLDDVYYSGKVNSLNNSKTEISWLTQLVAWLNA